MMMTPPSALSFELAKVHKMTPKEFHEFKKSQLKELGMQYQQVLIYWSAGAQLHENARRAQWRGIWITLAISTILLLLSLNEPATFCG